MASSFPLKLMLVGWLCVTLTASAQGTQGSWQRLDGCYFVDQAFNDGDSFHVKWKGDEYIFRLYFVDTPEHFRKGGYHDRTDAQAKYFNIYKQDLYQVARQATAFTRHALEKRFTVWTRWEDAKGNSKLPRYFALVNMNDGSDLGQRLVEEGLARIYGVTTDPPAQPRKSYARDLTRAEEEARKAKRGAWAFSKP